MKTLLAALLILGLAACGGDDTKSVTDTLKDVASDIESKAGDAAKGAKKLADDAANQAGSAAQGAADATEAAKKMASDALAGSTSPEVVSCLGAVAKADFQGAIPICQQALAANPCSPDVKKALETAQQAVASQAGQATGAAADKLGQAASDAQGTAGALQGAADDMGK